MISDKSIKITNLYANIKSQEEFQDKNCIKVVTDNNDNAMYFSREPIPTQKYNRNVPMKKQVCVIPFERDFLFEYQNMKPTPLEIVESVDMMRILQNGLKVKMIPTKYNTFAVDTKADLLKVEKLMALQN